MKEWFWRGQWVIGNLCIWNVCWKTYVLQQSTSLCVFKMSLRLLHKSILFSRYAQIPGLWSPRQLNVVQWCLIFCTQLLPPPLNSCTELKAPENSEVLMLLLGCGLSVWNLLLVVILASRISRWLIDFWKICKPLFLTFCILCLVYRPVPSHAVVFFFFLWCCVWHTDCVTD